MYDQHNVPPPEYRVRTVVRHIVTRYCHPYTHFGPSPEESFDSGGGSSIICEVSSEQGAYDIAKALAKAEGATVQKD